MIKYTLDKKFRSELVAFESQNYLNNWLVGFCTSNDHHHNYSLIMIYLNFNFSVFDDPQIEKENHVRKRLKKIFNLKQDDFEDLKQFNDYLET